MLMRPLQKRLEGRSTEEEDMDLEVLCVYRLGPKVYIEKMTELVNSLRTSLAS